MRTSSPFRRFRRASDDVAADPTDPELVPARSGDGTAVLTGFLVLLLAIPSQLVVVSVGSAGTPAQIYGVLLFLWWVCSRLMGRTRRGGSRELRIALGLFAVVHPGELRHRHHPPDRGRGAPFRRPWPDQPGRVDRRGPGRG